MKFTVGIALCLLVVCLLFCQTASAKKQDEFEKVLIKALALLKKQKKERLRFSHPGFVPRISAQADEKIITTGLGRIVKKNGRSYWVLADEKITTTGMGRVKCKNGRCFYVQ